MVSRTPPAPYVKLYALLLRLYPKPFRSRFGEGMVQTYSDLCRERRDAGESVLPFVLWTFLETFAGIMRERMKGSAMHKNIVARAALVAGFLLLIPLVAMQFTDAVVWDRADFLVGGALLFSAALGILWALKRTGPVRTATGLAVGAVFLLVWSNLAVGILGSEENPANLLYFGVVALGFLGAMIARFRASGMAVVLFVMALATALVPLIAWVVWEPQGSTAQDFVGLVGIHAFFVMLFAGSGLLYRRASAGPVRS